MRELAPFTSLTKLDLTDCHEVTDAGLRVLAAMTGLTSLNLANCYKVTDAGLATLPPCTVVSRKFWFRV